MRYAEFELNKNHWDQFLVRARAIVPQGPIGVPPSAWVTRCLGGETDVPNGLSKERLTRKQVEDICRDRDVNPLVGYICAMAWGGQRNLPRGEYLGSAVEAWRQRDEIYGKCEELRDCVDASSAYSIFGDGNSIRGLGPAYFSKLISFFVSGDKFFIMDQWTARSVNLLLKSPVVDLLFQNSKSGARKNAAVSNKNDGPTYERFCSAIEFISIEYKEATGEYISPRDLEIKLFDTGGKSPGPWRSYLREKG